MMKQLSSLKVNTERAYFLFLMGLISTDLSSAEKLSVDARFQNPVEIYLYL